MKRLTKILIISVAITFIGIILSVGFLSDWIFTSPASPSPSPLPTPSPNPDPVWYTLLHSWESKSNMTIPPKAYSLNTLNISATEQISSAPAYSSVYYHWVNFDVFHSSLVVTCDTPSTFYIYINGNFHSEIKGNDTISDLPVSELSFGNPNAYSINITVYFQASLSNRYYRSDWDPYYGAING
jgi:hypothetical protein